MKNTYKILNIILFILLLIPASVSAQKTNYITPKYTKVYEALTRNLTRANGNGLWNEVFYSSEREFYFSDVDDATFHDTDGFMIYYRPDIAVGTGIDRNRDAYTKYLMTFQRHTGISKIENNLDILYEGNTLKLKRYNSDGKSVDYKLFDRLFFGGNNAYSNRFEYKIYITANFIWIEVLRLNQNYEIIESRHSPILWGIGTNTFNNFINKINSPSVKLYRVIEHAGLRVPDVLVPGYGDFKVFKFSLSTLLEDLKDLTKEKGNLTGHNFLAIYVNDKKKATINRNNSGDIPVINAKMGDDITFKMSSPSLKNLSTIRGLPKVWEAPFAGDMMFHCDPNFGPNTVNPFIGLDSRVHTLMLRPFPKGYSPVEYGWYTLNHDSDDHNYTSTWSYTAQRRMSPDVANYNTGYYQWHKKHKNKDGSFKDQRQNQKEGLNMKFLYHWSDWENSNFYGPFEGTAKYMMGFDDDELAYFNHRFKETTSPHAITTNKANGGVAKLERMFWKEMPEGPSLYNSDTGYPSEGHPLNIMVNAFRKNQNAKNTGSYYQPYYGYEIQDVNTGTSHPNGDGTANLKHPGTVIVANTDSHYEFKLNVTSPLDDDRGFYGSLIGPDAPAASEQNVKYYVTGVENKSDEEKHKYKINYNYMDRLGIIKTKSISMYDILYTSLIYTKDNTFDLEPSAYAWVTATYQRTPESKPVIIAGKELNQIFLKFCGIKTLNDQPFPEGKGHGIEIWQEDFRSSLQGEYNQERRHGNTTKYANLKSYVFKKGSKVTFTTFDGDPHRLDNDEEEWYLSNRSMARRVKSNLLHNSSNNSQSYLKYYISSTANSTYGQPIHNGRNGKDLTYTFNNTGDFNMKVSYRGTSELFLNIKVIEDLPRTVASSSNSSLKIRPKGKIVERNLTNEEKKFLGLSTWWFSRDDYKAYVISDVYTEFKRKNGHRSYEGNELGVKLANRWSKYNDYNDNYSWYKVELLRTREVGGLTLLSQNEIATNFITAYETDMASATSTWVWKDWANHYSSVWKGKLKIGTLDGLPPYVANNTVTRLNELSDLSTNFGTYIDNNIFADGVYQNQKKAPWQFVIPLMSTTKYYGYRQRTNPSCIYDMRKVFDEGEGAFSGDPNPDILTGEDIQAPNTNDETKNKQDFYYDLKYKRILISSPLRGEYRVYNRNPVSGSNDLGAKIINQQSFGSNANTGRKQQLKESDIITNINSEIPVEYSDAVKLYPNPSSGIVTITLDKEWNHSLTEVRVFNSVGREVFIQQIKTPKGLRSISVDLSSLQSGYYILNGSYENGYFVRTLIIK